MANSVLLYVIYDNPKDHPNKFVVRQWEITREHPEPGPCIGVFDTLAEARELLPEGVNFLPKFDQDDPCVCEVYIT